MSPDPQYTVGREIGVGTEGNAPILLWQLWPPFIALCLSFAPDSEFSFYTITLERVVQWILVLPIICLIVLLVFQRYVKRKYQTEFSNQRFEELISQAKSRMRYTLDFEIWLLPQKKHILMGNAGFLYTALIVSEPTVQDILATPEEGEVILASAVKNLQLVRKISTWGSIAFLFIMTTIFTILKLVTPVGWSWGIAVGWLVMILFPSPMVMRYAREKSNDIEMEYGIHPNAARLIVFRGSPPTDREVQKYITREFGVFDDYSQYRRALGLFLISAIVSIVVGILFYMFLLRVSSPLFSLVEGFRIGVSWFVAIIVFAVFYIGLMSHFIPELE
ncbi:MAG: hypothetical protein ACFFEK_12825 [Candidatus Thorarchaeota archaeon]